jgi:3-hydroxymyristoyl/3-hydroxydecanoyl-(acyl carrier protein) dehydratase
MLLMIDRVTAFDRTGGRAGLGFVRAEKTVDPAEWFFKAHFFQDPVQPGSLGLEAMLQTLQFYMIHEGLADGPGLRFEPIALGRTMTWKYRGQVVPRNRVVTITLEVVEVGRDAEGPYALADASLWVDGKRIYQATAMGMRVVGGTDLVQARPAWRRLPPADLLPAVSAFWRGWFGATVPEVDDLYRGLIERFVGRTAFEDQGALAAACRAPVLFLGNHQTAVESTIFAIVASAVAGAPVLTLAKIENRRHWLDLLMRHTFAHPALRDPRMTQYFDRQDRASLLGILDHLAEEMTTGGRSVMVHVEGTRALSCRQPVRTMSGTFVDLSLRVDRPIVPVRFVGGLPAEPLAARTEFPVGMGRQDIYFGRPIPPAELRELPYRERTRRVMSAINRLGPANDVETPLSPQPRFETSVREWMAATGAGLGHAAVLRCFEGLSDASPATRRLVEAAGSGVLRVGSSPEELWLAELARRLFGARGPAIRKTQGDDV